MNTPLQILLVEDSPHDAEFAISALQSVNLADHLVHLPDGQAALDFLFGTGAFKGRDVNLQPKVVLLDLKMPKVGGMEVLRQLRADERTKRLPVVVLTSSHEDRDVAEAYQLGANSYIVKPADFEVFSTAMADIGRYWLTLNITSNP
jgi:two-component system response regulator